VQDVKYKRCLLVYVALLLCMLNKCGHAAVLLCHMYGSGRTFLGVHSILCLHVISIATTCSSVWLYVIVTLSQ
jgi:hypothetical protein